MPARPLDPGGLGGPHPSRGIDPVEARRNHGHMDAHPTPQSPPQVTEMQLSRLLELAERLRELNAELEFVRLMMAMRLPRPRA